MSKEIINLSKEMAKFNKKMGTEALIDYLATSLVKITKELDQGNISIGFDKDVKVIVDIEGFHEINYKNV